MHERFHWSAAVLQIGIIIIDKYIIEQSLKFILDTYKIYITWIMQIK